MDRLENPSFFFIGTVDVGKHTLIKTLKGHTRIGFKELREDVDFIQEFGSNLHAIDFRHDMENPLLKSSENAVFLATIDVLAENIENTIHDIASKINKIRNESCVIWLLITKHDKKKPQEKIGRTLGSNYIQNIIETSCKDGTGIELLRDEIKKYSENLQTGGAEDEIYIAIKSMCDSLCRAVAKSPDILYKIEWRDLERIVATALEGLGFSVNLTRPSKDGGKDIVACCFVKNKKEEYFIEVKHWVNKGRVGCPDIISFVEIIVKDNISQGLFLSTSGYTKEVYRELNSISKSRVKIGDKNKVVALCHKYVMSKDGLMCTQSTLPELLFEGTD